MEAITLVDAQTQLHLVREFYSDAFQALVQWSLGLLGGLVLLIGAGIPLIQHRIAKQDKLALLNELKDDNKKAVDELRNQLMVETERIIESRLKNAIEDLRAETNKAISGVEKRAAFAEAHSWHNQGVRMNKEGKYDEGLACASKAARLYVEAADLGNLRAAFSVVQASLREISKDQFDKVKDRSLKLVEKTLDIVEEKHNSEGAMTSDIREAREFIRAARSKHK